MTQILINLLCGEYLPPKDLLGVNKDFSVISPLQSRDENLSAPMQLVVLREIFEKVSQTPDFDLSSNILVVARPTIQSIAFIIGIKAAFPYMRVWFCTSVSGIYVDLSQMELEGLDFAMTWNAIKRNRLQEDELFTQSTL